MLRSYLLILTLLLSSNAFSVTKEHKIKLGPDPKTITKAAFDTWSKETIYFLIPDRFYNGDKKNDFNVNKSNILFYHGGDLKGINDNFSYFKKLNTSTLVFTPIMDNRDTDFFGHWGLHGYWIIDHFKLDEHLGTEETLKKFTKIRKRSKKKFIIDLVLNHVGWDHPWRKKHPDWFHKLGDIKDFNDYKQLTEGDLTGLADLNQDNPALYKKLVDYTKHWIDITDADGIRMDAVKHIDHPFWRKYIAEINEYVKKKHKKNDFLFLGEYLHGDATYYKDYLQDGFNAFYDFPMHYTIRDVFAYGNSMMYLPSKLQFTEKIFPKNMLLLTFLDNHDLPRFLSLSDNVSVEDMHQALAFIMTIRGIPFIYYGTEAYMKGRDGDQGRHSLDIKNSPALDYIGKLNKIRHSSQSLQSGIREDLMAAKDHYVFRKVSPKEESLIFVTRGDKKQTLSLKLEKGSLFSKAKTVKDRISKRKFKVSKGELTVELGKKDIVIFTKKGKSSHYKTVQKRDTTPKTRKITVRFKTKRLAPRNGEELFIIGSSDIIGQWQPEKALGPLKKIDDVSYTIDVPASDSSILEYKFIKKANGKVRWERTPNRLVFVKKDTKTIENNWNQLN